MSLDKKTLLFVLVSVAALVGALNLGTRLIVLGGFEEAEIAEMTEKVAATRDILFTMVEEFSERADDWADWDDMAAYVADGNAEFEESNHQYSTMQSIGWDMYAVFTADGTERTALFRDRAAGAFAAVPAGLRAHFPALLEGAASSAPPRHGLALAEGRLWLVSSRAVRKSDESPAPVPGRIVTARLVDEAWMKRLQRFTFLDMHLSMLSAPAADALESQARAALAAGRASHVAAPDPEHLAGYATLTDIHGAPAVLLRVDRARKLTASGEAIISGTTVSLALGGLLLVIAALWAMRRAVLRPLRGLQAGVQQIQSGEHGARVALAGKDEFARLGGAFNAMAEAVEAREAALGAANAQTRLVLDATGDALLSCAFDGALRPDGSAAALAWFGPPAGPIWDYLPAETDDRTRLSLIAGFDQLGMDFLPFELLVDQLPTRFVRDGRTFGLAYRRIETQGEPDRLLVIARDESARVEAERAEREARELQIIVGHFVRDPEDVARFLAEGERLLAELGGDAPADEKKRALHTLKGNGAIMGFLGFSEACHALETELAEDPDALDAGRIARLAATWRETRARIAALAPEQADRNVMMTTGEHLRFLALLQRREDHARLATYARAWTFPTAQRAFARLGSQVGRIGHSLGKEVRFSVAGDDVRLNAAALDAFLGSLVHVARNAIDHGLEAPEARERSGKPAAGEVRVEARVEGDAFTLAFSDDGAGVAWERVAAKASALGLPTARREDLVSALFADAFTTRDEATATSGRGVGLSAVRAAVEELDGAIDVTSAPGAGTTFRFTFPLRRGDVKLAWTPPAPLQLAA